MITRGGARLPVSDGAETSLGSRSVNTIGKTVLRTQSRITSSDTLRRGYYFLRRRCIDVDWTDQMITCRT